MEWTNSLNIILEMVKIVFIILAIGAVIKTCTREITQTLMEEKRKSNKQAYDLLERYMDKIIKSIGDLGETLVKSIGGSGVTETKKPRKIEVLKETTEENDWE